MANSPIAPQGRTVTTSDAWGADPSVVRLAKITTRCRVLGPGTRAVIWVQGCPFRCGGCVAKEWLPFSGGEVARVQDLADAIIALDELDGVTFSGGEPFGQAAALAALIDALRAERDLSFMSYSGFTIEQLSAGTTAQRGLLDRLDLLVDGPFIASRHTDLRWRGSDNQRVHFLSERHAEIAETVNDRGAWLEFEALPNGEFAWMGIPPRGFRKTLDRTLGGP